MGAIQIQTLTAKPHNQSEVLDGAWPETTLEIMLTARLSGKEERGSNQLVSRKPRGINGKSEKRRHQKVILIFL